MKTFAIVLVLGLAWQVSRAFDPTNVETCLVDNGLTKSADDVALVDCIGKPEGVDKLKDAPKEKLNAALACMFRKEYKDATLFDMLKLLTVMDDKMPEDQNQKLRDTLNACVEQAKGNDAELLNCVKAVDSPFDYFIATLRDLDEQFINFCFPRCGVKICKLLVFFSHKTCSNTKNKKIKHKYGKQIEEIKRMPRDKFTCLTACRLNHKDDPKQIFYNMIAAGVKQKPDLPEDKRTEMKNILDNCNTEGYKTVEMTSVLEKSIAELAPKLAETYKLLKCVNFLEAPISDILRP
ncbi:hypothetical protein TSAR_011139 [Trichomalopsis sarcophagae]|uniref:Uncharacterized protein n=1 Tax=Trichomalopsis sarcophagae TaxID=543379 RepID=A0A232FGP0_9HYME|nr:hypothetical protein TSAR_011139 [Trichomalopsis sarcophagae]